MGNPDNLRIILVFLLKKRDKNIGRDVRVLLQDTKEIKGTLEEVKDNGIVVREQVKGKNKKQTSYSKETTVISFNDINKTNILIQF